MEMKKCSKCKKYFELNNFCKCNKSKDGFQSQCKECKSEYLKEYYRKNPSKKHKRSKKENRERYENNKINWNFSRRMRFALNGLKEGKSWESLIGYNLIDLKLHLEKRFKPGMTWNNYGDWHIDHIKPITAFDVTSTECEDFKKCWSLENLQPLWAEENISKGNR